MKWLVVLGAILAVYPIARFVRTREKYLIALTAVMCALPFINLDPLDIDLVVDAGYHGEANGFTISIVDLLAGILFLALPRSPNPAPYRLTRYAYLACAVFSVFFAAVPLYAWFSISKLLRGFFMLATIVRVAEHKRLGPWIINGLASGVILSAFMCVYQRYILHYNQVDAWMPHQNTLGMAVDLVFPIALAILLVGPKWKFPLATVGASAICIVLTLSRGSIAMFVLGAMVVFFGSLIRKSSTRKIRMGIIFGLCAILVVAKSYDSIIDRFEHAPEASAAARDKFVSAAKEMLANHPTGIGINQYSYVLGHQGYAQRQNLPRIDYGGIAHHIYWLTLAELSYIGLFAYLCMLAVPLYLAGKYAWKARDDVRGDVLLGCFAGLFAMYAQGTLEWAARQTPLIYMYFIFAGFVAVLARQLEEKLSTATQK
ncbi:MAG: O-antigen ligase family protein [Sandaracinaceae bacterium]|nr:O-antigen ligase family protein [Sandaracinaceae bacterium]